MRTINILNVGYDDYHTGDIVDISGSTQKTYNGRFVVNCVRNMEFNVSVINSGLLWCDWCDDTKLDKKPKKYRSTFIKSHKKVW